MNHANAVLFVECSLLGNCYQVQRQLMLIICRLFVWLAEFSCATIAKSLKEAVADPIMGTVDNSNKIWFC